MAYTARPVGFLAETVERIRDYSNEPEDNPKYTTDKLFPLIRDGYRMVMQDVNACADAPIVVRYDLSVNTTDQVYYLPPNVGQIIAIGKFQESNGLNPDITVPRYHRNPWGAGVRFEGPVIRFEPFWRTSETLRIEYIPNGDCSLHLGTFNHTATGVSTSAFPLSASPSEGYFDRRPNGYIGCIARLLSAIDNAGSGVSVAPAGYTSFPIQERLVASQAALTNLASVVPNFDFNPATLIGTTPTQYTYEVVPALGQYFQSAIVWWVVKTIHGTAEGRVGKRKYAEDEYREARRLIRRDQSARNVRSSMTFRGDIPGYGRVGFNYGYWI